MKNPSTKPKQEIKQRVAFYISDSNRTDLLKAVKGSGLSVSSFVTQMVVKQLKNEIGKNG